MSEKIRCGRTACRPWAKKPPGCTSRKPGGRETSGKASGAPRGCVSLVTHCSKSSGQEPRIVAIGALCLGSVPFSTRLRCLRSWLSIREKGAQNAHLQIGNARPRYGDAVARVIRRVGSGRCAPAYRAPLAPPFYHWTGLYVGVHAGAGWADLGSAFGTGNTGALSLAGRSDTTIRSITRSGVLRLSLRGRPQKTPSAYPA